MSSTAPAFYQMGRLHFSIAGAGPRIEHLRDEFAPLRDDAGTPAVDANGQNDRHPAHLVFDFVESLPKIAGYAASKPIYVLDDSYRVSYRGMSYHVSRLHHASHRHSAPPHASPGSPAHPRRAVKPIHVALRVGRSARRGRLSVALERTRDPGFLSADEKFVRSFMYDVFDHLSQLMQLPLGQSYIHASSVERDGEGTAIIAWSEVGKTAALVKLITDHGFRFLSDDVALVDDSGMLWRTPKLIQLKAINVAGEPHLRRMLLSDRSALDRFSWAQRRWRHGELAVRRRVSAERFFGTEAITRNAPLRRVICLERAEVPDFEAKQISPEELCRRATEMMTGILEPFAYLSRAIHSGHQTPILPTRTRMREDTAAVLGRAFGSVPVFNVRVPLAASPASLSTYLLKLFDEARRRPRVSMASVLGG